MRFLFRLYQKAYLRKFLSSIFYHKHIHYIGKEVSMKQIQIIRRKLHQIPELDKCLPKTITFIENKLASFKCTLFHPIQSAVCAYFDFQQSTTIAFRSDMDALPIQERSTVSYCSKHKGQMHACGHDAHMAMLLAFAAYLNKQKDCKHNVLLIFQPAEETTGGAKDIVDTGILSDYHVLALFGIHVMPKLKKGTIASKSGYLMARSAQITLEIKGKSAHIAHFHEGKDALYCAMCFIQRIYDIADNYKKEAHLLKFGLCNSGHVCNAISDYTLLKGTLRVFSDNSFHYLCEQMSILCKQLEKESGCSLQLSLSQGYPSLYNDPDLFKRCQILLPDMSVLSKPNLLTEDFAYYGSVVQTIFFYLGIGDVSPLHSDTFDFDDSCLTKGLSTYIRLLDICL